MVEPLLLLIVGIPFLMVGTFCLRQYEAQLHEDFMRTVSWDMLVEAIGAGGTWGRVAVVFLAVGVCLVLVGALGTGLVVIFTIHDLLTPGS
jgi:hypothetical protein